MPRKDLIVQAYYLTKFGSAEKAFSLEELKKPVTASENAVEIEVEGFGINFADVMARLGLYAECPKLPAIIGYEVVGRCKSVIKKAKGAQIPEGVRVLAFTRFGGYAQRVWVEPSAVFEIPEDCPLDVACALATQYVTAYYVVEQCIRPWPGERGLVQAAAGGVGLALVQLLKLRNVFVIGTAGGEKKGEFLKGQGVDLVIDYQKMNFFEFLKEKIQQEKWPGLNFVVDSLGGKAFGQGFKLLAPTGKIVGLGGASFASTGKGLGALGEFLGFGFYHPVQVLQESKQLIGVNMLKVADHTPYILEHCLREVIELYKAKKISPHGGGIYTDLVKAHQDLEGRKTMGKIAVKWSP